MKVKFGDKAKEVISTVAPALGAALGGPLGALAGNIVATAIGGKDGKQVEEAILGQAPETLLALRKAEQEFELRCKELELEPERLATSDRASARELAKVNMRPQMALSAAFTAGYFVIFAWLLFSDIELNIRQATMVNVLMGVLTAGVVKILDFWFGSTAGSALKSQLLYQSRPGDTPA